MKITAIKTFLGSFGNRSRGLIKVETDEGLYGWGEAYSVGPDRSVEPIADYIFEIEDMLSDYREVAGMMLPFKSTTKRNGQPGGEVTIGEIEINPTLAEELFTLPD